MFSACDSLLNFEFFEIRFISDFEVPANTERAVHPIEYKSIRKMPHTTLPLPAITIRSDARIGVEHGEENIPESIPTKKAPM